METPVHALWSGLTDYEKSLYIQQELMERCRRDDQSYLLGLEHPPSITLGKRSSRAEDVLWSSSELLNRGLSVYEVERGGEATLHAPGQLVIYPILNLPKRNLSVRSYVSLIIDVTRKCLEDLGVSTQCGAKEPGLFTEQGKIAAFGVRVKRGVTQHGLAINCNNSLQLFDSIRSCGVKEQKWTHLQALGQGISPRDLFKKWHRQFLLTEPSSSV